MRYGTSTKHEIIQLSNTKRPQYKLISCICWAEDPSECLGERKVHAVEQNISHRARDRIRVDGKPDIDFRLRNISFPSHQQ